MSQETFISFAFVVSATLSVIFASCALSVLFKDHEANKPEPDDEPQTCPFCENVLSLDDDGHLTCDCPEFKAVMSAKHCAKCDIIHTGKQCPKCAGREVWCE